MRTHCSTCKHVAVDAKAFEGICKADSTRPAFVEASEASTTTVRLATDLAKYYALTQAAQAIR
jgi:hypothetical protein